MATPTLTGLPPELLVEIIPHVLPEGFESLALTCKTIYGLCKAFIEHHNRLRQQFRNFRYGEPDKSLCMIRTAFDLIKRVAIEPVVARYIRDADFHDDTFPFRGRSPQAVPDFYYGEPVATLIADSPYLRQAGIDGKEYYALIKEDLKQGAPAAFILTLLPNVKTRLCYQDYGSRSIKPRYFSTLLLAKVRSHISYEIELVLLK